MTSEQIFHILGMRHVWKILKALNEKPMLYSEILSTLQVNNCIVYRLLLLLTNAGLIIHQNKTYSISVTGSRMVDIYCEFDTPRRISWDGGDISELVV